MSKLYKMKSLFFTSAANKKQIYSTKYKTKKSRKIKWEREEENGDDGKRMNQNLTDEEERKLKDIYLYL